MKEQIKKLQTAAKVITLVAKGPSAEDLKKTEDESQRWEGLLAMREEYIDYSKM